MLRSKYWSNIFIKNMPNEFFLSVGLIFNAMIIYFAIAKNVKQGMQESVRLESRLTKIETILEQILSERK